MYELYIKISCEMIIFILVSRCQTTHLATRYSNIHQRHYLIAVIKKNNTLATPYYKQSPKLFVHTWFYICLQTRDQLRGMNEKSIVRCTHTKRTAFTHISALRGIDTDASTTRLSVATSRRIVCRTFAYSPSATELRRAIAIVLQAMCEQSRA